MANNNILTAAVEARYKAVDMSFKAQVLQLQSRGSGRELDTLLQRLDSDRKQLVLRAKVCACY